MMVAIELVDKTLYMYIYIYIRGAYYNFQTFFVWAFKIFVDSWKFSMLLRYILLDDWPIFMISASNKQLLKLDCHSCWISKMQSDTLEERYAIKILFLNLEKITTETYGMLQTSFGASCMNRASVVWVA